MKPRARDVRVLVLAAAGLLSAALYGHHAPARSPEPEQPPAVREITITARRYEFVPPRIDVRTGEILRITLVAEDIAHSFTIDAYRISKRAAPGQSVTFEFCADQPGRFAYYCSLTTDERCREMRGELVVR